MELPPFQPDRAVSPVPPGVPAWAGGPVLLVGGTFDPVHEAHVTLADQARRLAMGGRGTIVFVPAARSPHKGQPPQASDAQRVEMLRLAIADLDRASIWTEELDRSSATQASYWIDTLERAAALGAADIRFLIGADQALAFHRWREARRILGLARALVLPRGGLDSPGALVEAMRGVGVWSEGELERWREGFVRTPVIEVSATAIRDALGDPAQREKPIEHLDERVRAYIVEHGLYPPVEASADE